MIRATLLVSALAATHVVFTGPPETPPPLQEAVCCLEAALQTERDDASNECVSYSALRANWEARWWGLIGYATPPSQEEIANDMRLHDAACLIGLALEGDGTIVGVKHLLHGCTAAGATKERDIWKDASLEACTDSSATFFLKGDKEEPVRAVFGVRDGRWKLVDVRLDLARE